MPPPRPSPAPLLPRTSRRENDILRGYSAAALLSSDREADGERFLVGQRAVSPVKDARKTAAAVEPVPQEKRVAWADLYIATKRKGLQPFRLNPIQIRYLNMIWPDWRAGGRLPRNLREIILKSRQFGFSTLIAALLFMDTVNYPGTTTVVVAQKGQAAENLFQIVHRFWRHLPREKQPHKEYSQKTEIFFDEIDSRYLVFTAGGESAAASFTIQNLHCSEAGLYPTGGDFWETTEGALEEGHANVFVESTARGESGRGETFCRMYRAARAMVDAAYAPKKRREDEFDDDEDDEPDGSAYTARFFAWWEHDEYEVRGGRLNRTDAEVTIVHKYNLDGRFGRARADDKLRWRRRRVVKMGALFAQEYPGDDKEAFLASGHRFFHEWDEEKHVYDPATVRVERYWQYIGGYDWGYAQTAPATFLLACVDERGRVLVIDERTMVRQTDPQQAETIRNCIEEHELDPANVPIYADPSIWNPKSDNFGRIFHNVRELKVAGLWMVKASNSRSTQTSGWQNVRRYLFDTTTERDRRTGNEVRTHFLRVSTVCRELIRTFPLQLVDPKNPNDLDTTGPDHHIDSLRYLLGSKPRPTETPARIPQPDAPRPLKNSQLPHALQTEGADEPDYLDLRRERQRGGRETARSDVIEW